jgi:hypothetical protein
MGSDSRPSVPDPQGCSDRPYTHGDGKAAAVYPTRHASDPEKATQLRPGPGRAVPLTDRGNWQRPANSQVRVVVTHRDVLGWVMLAVNPVADIGLLGKRLEPVQEARRNIEVGEPLVVEQNAHHGAERPRAWAGVDEHVVYRPTRATDQLPFTTPGPSVHATDRPLPGTRLAVLDERRRVEARLSRQCRVEGPGEQSAVVAVWRRYEQPHTVDLTWSHLHAPILADPPRVRSWSGERADR